jgi:hypothetical protein
MTIQPQYYFRVQPPDADKPYHALIGTDDQTEKLVVMTTRKGGWLPDDRFNMADLLMPEYEFAEWDILEIEPEQAPRYPFTTTKEKGESQSRAETLDDVTFLAVPALDRSSSGGDGGRQARGYPEFNPNQPRDHGRFSSTGGAAAESKPSAKSGKKAKKEDFEKAKITLSVSGGSEGEQEFIDQWNERIGIEPEKFKKQFLGGVDSVMTISTMSGISGGFYVKSDLQDEGGREIGICTRKINLDNKSAQSSYFQLKESATKHDIGKKVLAGNIEMYEQIGVDEVAVGANIDVGGYAWAKYGYVPTQRSWDELRADLERKLVGGSSRPSSRSGNTIEAEEWS